MPRPLRAFFDGFFHLTVHGSDTRVLYVTAADRVHFLALLSRVFARQQLIPIAYTLMGNHYHLILHAPDSRVSFAMQQLHTRYSREHNQNHKRNAHLFRAHFGAKEITSDEQLIAAIRYVAVNPVEAGLARSPLDWRWGSARAHAGLEAPAIPLDEMPLREAFDNHPTWRHRYRRLVMS